MANLVLDNIGWAEGMARRYSWHPHFDQLLSEANLGLVQAAKSYNPEVGEFRPFARQRVLGAMRDYLRKESKQATITPRRSHRKPTERQVATLAMLAARKSRREIAAAMGTSYHAVHLHIWRIYKLLGVSGREAAVREAMARGILSRKDRYEERLRAIEFEIAQIRREMS